VEVANKIYQIVKNMPEKQANEVLDFAEFLYKKSADQVQQKVALKPLPVFKGYVLPGWKDAIYEQEF
jgi:hypothetical protein